MLLRIRPGYGFLWSNATKEPQKREEATFVQFIRAIQDFDGERRDWGYRIDLWTRKSCGGRSQVRRVHQPRRPGAAAFLHSPEWPQRGSTRPFPRLSSARWHSAHGRQHKLGIWFPQCPTVSLRLKGLDIQTPPQIPACNTAIRRPLPRDFFHFFRLGQLALAIVLLHRRLYAVVCRG